MHAAACATEPAAAYCITCKTAASVPSRASPEFLCGGVLTTASRQVRRPRRWASLLSLEEGSVRLAASKLLQVGT